MGAVPLNNDSVEDRRFVSQNSMCYEQKEVRNGVAGKGQGLGSSEEHELRIHNPDVGVHNGSRVSVQVHDGLQISQQPPQGSVIRWERFLPIRSLKVLLVESDDSTRHLVSALLRNCSYEVTAVANGLLAWKILEDLTNHIDLVLTEVVTPVLSGIGLLCKTMSHKTLKNIPVIMMSSHDSMGIVFKCLSNGAVDFLVKPIRKNELKNLWQHVWRRCHSSSGSGSESGTRTKASARSKCNDDSENETDSSGEHDNQSNGLSIRDGSDHGSGTQSSWTKRAVEVDSPRQRSSSYPSADAPDSTCAQVIHTKPENVSDSWVHVTETKECWKLGKQLDDAAMGKDLEIGVSRKQDFQFEILSTHQTIKMQNKLPEGDCKPFASGQLEHNTEIMTCKSRDCDPNIVSAITSCTNPRAECRDFDAPNGPDNSQVKENGLLESEEMPSLELTLKRLRDEGVGQNTANEDRNVLRHSDLSAFSKYNTASSANQELAGNVGSCSPLDNGSAATKTEMVRYLAPNSSGTNLNDQSNGSSDNNDMASSAKYVTPKPEALNKQSECPSAFKSFHSSAFQPMQNGRLSSSLQMIYRKEDDARPSTLEPQLRDSSNQMVQVQHHHHHHHHYHHHVHNLVPHQPSPDKDGLSLKNMASNAPQCGSSNVFEGPTEANVGNHSVNGSASGSNHGSNGQNGSSTALHAGVANMDSDNGAAGNSGAGGSSGRISGCGGDEDRVAQREAALHKFRQKRKERCFEKRVRYQSRKKLAEQRPRVKGQFVRQTVTETKVDKDSASNDVASEGNSCDSAR